MAGVRFGYDGGPDVLHGIDLTVRPGERLAVVGPHGAGKTTLGRLLAGVDRPRAGRITVGGVPLADLPPDRLRRQVVLVTQEHHVFLGTLRDKPAAGHADRIAVLEEGRLSEPGTHDELVAAGGPYAALWRSLARRPATRLTGVREPGHGSGGSGWVGQSRRRAPSTAASRVKRWVGSVGA